jgi:hypothetical protein
MLRSHKSGSIFKPKIVHIPPAPIINAAPESDNSGRAPIEIKPATRAEIKDANKRKYLPAERLAIKLNKQLEKERRQKNSQKNITKKSHNIEKGSGPDDILLGQLSNSLQRIITQLI